MDESVFPATDLTERAIMLIGVKRHADAVPLLARAVASDPASWQPHCLLAVCLLTLGRPSEALAHADGAVSLQPAEEWPHRVRSAALLALRRRTKAVRAAREAVRLDPTGVLAHAQLAHALLGSHRRRSARRAAERAVRLDPSASHAYNALGVVALSESKNRVAQAAFRKALELDPESPEALNNLGVALRLDGRVGEAVDLFVSSARIDPRDPASPKNLSAMSNTLLRMAYVGLCLLLLAAGIQAAEAARLRSPWFSLGVPIAAGGLYLLTRRWRRERATMRPRLLQYSLGFRGLLLAIAIVGVFVLVAALIGGTVFAVFLGCILGVVHLTSLGPDRQILRIPGRTVPVGAFRQRSIRRGVGAFAVSLMFLGIALAGLILGAIPELLEQGPDSSGNLAALVILILLGVTSSFGAWRAFKRVHHPDADLIPIPGTHQPASAPGNHEGRSGDE